MKKKVLVYHLIEKLWLENETVYNLTEIDNVAYIDSLID
jgi:hypothetical protein